MGGSFCWKGLSEELVSWRGTGPGLAAGARPLAHAGCSTPGDPHTAPVQRTTGRTRHHRIVGRLWWVKPVGLVVFLKQLRITEAGGHACDPTLGRKGRENRRFEASLGN